jgi:GNAT superfamily N-acetyltransferase
MYPPDAAILAETPLSDGRRICYRRIRPDDAERLQAFHSRLSRETTRLRFFSPMPRLNNKMASYFVDVDFDQRCALVAHFPGEDEIRGVGRYERDSKHAAEVAFVVEDALQGLGIGRMLMKLLAEHARAMGIDRLTAMTLAENLGMLTVFRECGHPTDITFEGETAHVKIDIRDHEAAKRVPKSLVPSMIRKS